MAVLYQAAMDFPMATVLIAGTEMVEKPAVLRSTWPVRPLLADVPFGFIILKHYHTRECNAHGLSLEIP